MASISDQDKEWVSVPEAARILGANVVSVRRLIASGALTVRKIPHCYTKVSRTDIVRLVEASTIPAKTHL